MEVVTDTWGVFCTAIMRWMDEEQVTAWMDALEKPQWDSIETLFDKAALSNEEVAALDKYRSRTEHYLLRLKPSMAMDMQRPSLLRHIAGYLRWLNSDKVVGSDGQEPPRQKFIQEMFRDRPVHNWYQEEIERTLESGEVEKGVRTRFTSRSTALWDKYAELEVLAFFCANGYSVEFPASGGSEKRPEFYLTAGPHRIGVEVKNLDSHTALDHIFGSSDHYAAPPPPDGNQEIPNDIPAVVGTINTQYKSACEKFTDVPILIVIYVPWPPSLLQPNLGKWLKDLTTHWNSGGDQGIAGVILAHHDDVEKIVNPAHREVVDELQFDSIPLKELRNVYVRCTRSNLWPD